MSGQNSPTPQQSPFEIVSPAKSKKIGSKGVWIAVAIVTFLILSVVAGVLLVRQQQNIQEKAAPSAQFCPDAGACPFYNAPHGDNGTLLRDCYPAQSDNTPKDSTCNAAGRIAPCGPARTQYCCPSAGSAWTADMTVCNSLAATPTPAPPTPTPTVTPTPTATAAPNTCNGSCVTDSTCQSGLICSGSYCRNPLCASATDCTCGAATPTPTATAGTAAPTQSVQSSPRPIPVTGVDWPTVAGVGVGAAAIILSILIAI